MGLSLTLLVIVRQLFPALSVARMRLPAEGEFELTGDDDLGAADLGPAAPNATDPDADSGRIRKIT